MRNNAKNRGMSTSIRYREIATSPELNSHVLNYWEFVVERLVEESYDHHVPPDGCVSIVVKYSQDVSEPFLVLVGPRGETLNVEVTCKEHYFGMRFWPHAARGVLGELLDRAEGLVGPTMHFLPQVHGVLLEKLPSQPDPEKVFKAFEQFGSVLIQDAEPIDPLIREAVEQLVAANGGGSISNLADHLKLSLRQLQRRFRNSTGLSPKTFARVRRFRSAAAELLTENPRPWATVAYEAGYSDQSHLAREFSQLIGLTALELAEKHSVIEHDNVDP